MWCARAKRRNASGPPRSGGGGGQRTESARASARRLGRRGSVAGSRRDRSRPVADPAGMIARHHARCADTDGTLAERLLAGDKRALARAISLVEDDDPEGWELVTRGLSADRQRGGGRLHRTARGREIDAARRADEARAGARADGRRCSRSIPRRRSPRARCWATGSASAITSSTRACSSARWPTAARWAG